MQININYNRKIHGIQEEFSTLFPNLKLEFYVKPPNTKAPHPKTFIKSDSKTLGECRNVHNKGTITIDKGMTIGDLRSHFNEAYGLDIEVLKKDGNSWVEASSPNKMSLEEHNKTS